MNNKVGIRELAMALVNKKKLSLKEAENFVATMFDTLNAGLNDDKLVKLKGLGTFKVTSVSARKSVDVNTGEPIIIDGRDKISFTPDNTMKDLVNKPFAQFDTVVINDSVDIKDLERLDLLETPTDIDTTALNDMSEEEEDVPNTPLPPSKVELAVNEAAEVLAENAVEPQDEPGPTHTKLPEKSHTLTLEQLSALNGDPQPMAATSEQAENAANELTLTTEQLRLLNDDEASQTHDNDNADAEENELQSQANVVDTDAPVALVEMETTDATIDAEQSESILEQEEATYAEPEMAITNATPAPSDEQAVQNTSENEPVPEQANDADVDAIANDSDIEELEEAEQANAANVDDDNNAYADTPSLEEQGQPISGQENELCDASNEETTSPNIANEEEEDVQEDKNTYDDEEDEWEEEERRKKRRRLIAACIVGVLVVIGGVAWYLMNQMQLKDNRISHLETLLNTSKSARHNASAQALSAADSAREDSINKVIDAQTKADLAASEAKIAQSIAEKQAKADDKMPNMVTNESKKLTEKMANKPTSKQEKEKESKASEQDFKQYEKDARVRTGAYKIVGIDYVVTVSKGQTLYSLSKSMLGPGMECYIEAVNGNVKELKAGQKIKIPKLELKKRK